MTMADQRLTGVLIIDDRESLLAAYTVWLEEDFKVYTATTGEAGLTLLHQQGDAIALVLLDVHLPDMPGLDVLRQIKTLAPHLVVVTLSGLPDAPLEAEARRLGAAQHLIKPFDLGPTRDLLQALLTDAI